MGKESTKECAKKPRGLFRVLFVCTGNTCRSPMAVGILTKVLGRAHAGMVEITSAGTHAADGSPASDSALEVTRKQGIDITRHRSRKLGKQMIENSDLVLVMERSHMNAVRQLCPGRGEHVMLLGELGGAARADRSSEGREILDPVAGSVATYEMCFARIEESLTKGLGFLSGLISSRGISSEREE